MGKQSKTAREWFEMLNEPERSEAIENVNKSLLGEKFESLEDALDLSFWWGGSPQGHDYWQWIHGLIFTSTYPFKENEKQGEKEK